MRGPQPKDPKLRQRRNKSVSRAVLQSETNPIEDTPELPTIDSEWNELTLAWWEDIWNSPMSSEFLRTDVLGLQILAIMVNKFWQGNQTGVLIREIRGFFQLFGLTPLDRRRLEWQITSNESAKDKLKDTREKRAKVINGDGFDIGGVLENGSDS